VAISKDTYCTQQEPPCRVFQFAVVGKKDQRISSIENRQAMRGRATILIRLHLVLLLIGALIPWPAAAQEGAPSALLGGRWSLTLRTPQGAFQTPVEFVVDGGGKVTATILGPLGTFRISDAKGTLVGERLRLSATSSFGNLRVNARLEGGRLTGHWGPGGLISGLFFRGEMHGVRDDSYARAAPTQIYDKIWTSLERQFYAPDYNGIDIRSLRERYRSQVAASRTDGEFLAIIRRMLGEFRTSHLDLFAVPPPQIGMQPPAIADLASQAQGISWREISPEVGYLRIESFEDSPDIIGRIDQSFSELRRNQSLIIDIRENGGGNLSAAMRLGDYIFAEQRPVGYFASRDGLMRHGAASIDALTASALPVFTGYSSAELAREMHASGAVMLATGGRAREPYRGRVVILVDEHCFSACEAFASVAKETSAATLVGRRTAGAMLAAVPIDMEGGWTLLLPVWDFRTPGGARVEGRGVEPDIAVRRSGRTDADLAAALRHLRGEGP
jgi:hypothetical protein